MEDCQECGGLITEGNECESCHTTVEVCLFISVIKVMSEKVKVYKDAMQERLQIIREDIISSITEETMKYQKILRSTAAETVYHNTLCNKKQTLIFLLKSLIFVLTLIKNSLFGLLCYNSQ